MKKLIKKFVLSIIYIRPKIFLKIYLKCYEKYHRRIISQLGKRIYKGRHPKNVFNYRKEFFVQNVREDDVVIDIGCGTGIILNAIAPTINKGYGIEFLKENLEICKKYSSDNIKYIEANLFEIDYKELKNKFRYNTVVFSHILEHVENVHSILTKVDAEKLLICVPSKENWYTQLLMNLGLPYFKDVTHYREYTREMLKEQLESAHYKVEYIGFNSESEIVCRALRRA